MPRDVSGNYSLPAGNPVVSQTAITVTWGNTTMSDLGQAMTDSLSRNGEGGMLAPFKFFDGTAGNPSLTFTNETNSGFYRAGSNDVRCSVAGVDVCRWTAGVFQTWDGALWVDVADPTKFAALAGATMTGQLKGIAPVAAEDLTRKDYVDTVGDTAVKLTGTQSIAGAKTFTTQPVVPTPTGDTKAANKGYVDTGVEARYKGNIAGDKTITISTSAASGGVNGDIWIQV
jgi:hypothetical protein